MNFLMPFISGLLYRAGGATQWKWCFVNQKIWRWLIGVLPAILLSTSLLQGVICAIAYLIAVTAFVYGEKSWLNFLGEWGKFFISGLALGACSFILLSFSSAVLQTLLSGISFVVLKYLDDRDLCKNPYQEFFRGFMGTCVYFVA